MPLELVKAETVTNERVAQIYRESEIVLNDHWDDMKKRDLVSNRLFDAVACGAAVVSDEIDGLEELLGGRVHTFSSPESFGQVVRALQASPPTFEQRQKASDFVRSHHSFAARAQKLDADFRLFDAASDHLAPAFRKVERK